MRVGIKLDELMTTNSVTVKFVKVVNCLQSNLALVLIDDVETESMGASLKRNENYESTTTNDLFSTGYGLPSHSSPIPSAISVFGHPTLVPAGDDCDMQVLCLVSLDESKQIIPLFQVPSKEENSFNDAFQALRGDGANLWRQRHRRPHAKACRIQSFGHGAKPQLGHKWVCQIQ